MVELLMIIGKMLNPFVLSYIFITITGYTFMDGIVTEFDNRIEKEGYEYTDLYEKNSSKFTKFIYTLKNVINPLDSLRLIITIMLNFDLPEMMIKEAIDDGMIIFKNNISNDKKDNYKEIIKNDEVNNNKIISNKEKLAYLENEKKFLLDDKKNNEDIIDEYVYTKKY